MLSKIKKIVFSFVIFMIGLTSIDALYNGSAGTSFPGTYTGNCPAGKYNCIIAGRNRLMIQARLYYIDNGSFSQIGSTYYFVDKATYDNTTVRNSGLNLIYVSEFDQYTTGTKFISANTYLKNYFGDVAGNPQTTQAKNFLNKVTGTSDYTTVLTKESQFANKTKAATKGYRIIIEPVVLVAYPSFSSDSYALMTVKGMASEAKRIGNGQGTNGPGTYSYNGFDVPTCTGRPGGVAKCNNNLLGVNSYAQLLYTDFKDVGIEAASQEYCVNSVNTDMLADMTNGCGMNIIDISQYADNECYSYSIKGEPLECKKSDENNKQVFTEKYTKMDSCTNATEEEKKVYTEYGKKVAENGTCKIYCIESAEASFPGSILKSYKTGSYFSWPTFGNNFDDNYQMIMTSKLKCKFVDYGAGADSVGATITLKCGSGMVEYDSSTCRESSSSEQGSCPSGYRSAGYSSNSCVKTIEKNKICPDNYSEWGSGLCRERVPVCLQGNLKSDGYCYKNSYYESYCGSGARLSDDKTYCIINKVTVSEPYCPKGKKSGDYCYQNATGSQYNYTCPKGWERVGTYGERCRKKVSYRNVLQCPDSSWTSNSYGSCTKDAYYRKTCGDWSFYGYNECRTPATMSASGKITGKVCPNGTEEEYGRCYSYSYSNKTCSGGKKLINGYCYSLSQKIVASYSCPEGYERKDTTCKKICNKDSLMRTMNNLLNDANKYKISAKLTAGTNNKIDTNLAVGSTTITVSDNNMEYTKTVKFKIPDNKNRYYNKVTDIVSDTPVLSLEVFDRGRGVVSTSKNDQVLVGNNLKEYDLKISDVYLGQNNIFGKNYIKNYVCHYSLSNEPCECPSGTKNAGDDVDELINILKCEGSNSDTNSNHYYSEKTSCVYLQKAICNRDFNESSNSDSTQKKYKLTCNENIKCLGNENVDITNCVKEQQRLNVTLETAIKYCTSKEPTCSSDYCYDVKTNARKDIKSCLNEGNSRETCLKRNNCLNTSCPDCYCTGICENKKISKKGLTLSYKKCNGGSSSYCYPNLYCDSGNEIVTASAKSCILKELNSNNLETVLKRYSISTIENALESCKSISCVSINGIPKVVYRVIDLRNPFPGKIHNGAMTGISSTESIKSREPGGNWNNKTVIKNEILNARGAKDYDLYKKQPLYTIKLTPDTIKKIREYNKNYNYANFDLKCNEKNSTACLSNFIHNNSFNVVVDGKSECTKLNMMSNLNDYNKCYNSNN